MVTTSGTNGAFSGERSPNHTRSTSVTPSEHSRITTVDEKPEISIHPEPPTRRYTVVATPQSAHKRWWQHLLGVLCIDLHENSFTVDEKTKRELEASQDCENPMSSPFVRPVHVLSRHPNRDQHYTPHQAQCTIDTGNNKGNIVSKEFLVEVLGYKESDFSSLTASEAIPGVDATEHELSLLGAIHLSWYFNASPRIFHDMRFLISPHPHCDLIIGARSIDRHNLLGAPILMVKGGQAVVNGKNSSAVVKLTKAFEDADEKHQAVEDDQLNLDEGSTKWKQLEQKRLPLKKALEIARRQLELQKAKDAGKSKAVIEQIEGELKKLQGSSSQPVPGTPSSTRNGGSSSALSSSGKTKARTASRK